MVVRVSNPEKVNVYFDGHFFSLLEAHLPLLDGQRRLIGQSWIKSDDIAFVRYFYRDQRTEAEQLLQDIQARLDASYAPKSGSQWRKEIRKLQCSMEKAGVRLCIHRLRTALARLASDPESAYRRLLFLCLAVLSTKLSHIDSRLRAIAQLFTDLLSAARQSVSAGNKMSSERRWYLYHGGHPPDSCSAVESCSTGGLTPAFA
jgi:hypothetical protein